MSEHQLFDAGSRRLFQHVKQFVDIDVHAFSGLQHGFTHQFAIRNGAFEKSVFESFQIVALAATEIVQDPDFLSNILIVRQWRTAGGKAEHRVRFVVKQLRDDPRGDASCSFGGGLEDDFYSIRPSCLPSLWRTSALNCSISSQT